MARMQVMEVAAGAVEEGADQFIPTGVSGRRFNRLRRPLPRRMDGWGH